MSETGQIRFSADILRRLGEELNPSIDQGIIELVKNAYDADALNCTVRIERSHLGDTISVIDDGEGMTHKDVIDGWLVLGRSSKETSRKTRLGRTPAGNKGLGRLAALRLGATATVSTVSRSVPIRTEVQLNWDEFDGVATVDEVQVPIRSEVSEVDDHGTRIDLQRLRSRIGRMDVKRLARAMILLADPFEDSPTSFRPVLEADDHDDLSDLVSRRYFNDAEYHLIATVEDGIASAEVTDWKGKVLYRANNADLNRDVKYAVPDASFDLWAFSLNSRTFVTRSTSLGEVREWLAQVGGVHIYSNGLRVAPYGNAGSDWLDMNVARNRSPEDRPSTNNSIGRVRITDPENALPQKTDRSGFIEGPSFVDLRRFAVDALDWMARQRTAASEARRRKARADAASNAKTSEERVQRQIAQVDPANRAEISTAFREYARDRDREAEVLRNEVQLYRTLSTAGITTATFAHESNGGPIKVITQSVGAIARRGQKELPDSYEKQLAGPVASIERAVSTLSVLAQATLRLVDQDKRRIGRVNLHDVVRTTLETLSPFFDGRDVVIDLRLTSGQPYLRGSEAAIESILTNLLNNSVVAFELAAVNARTISVSTRIESGDWILEVADNGPGIEGITVREVWLPGETRRPGGTGLGLTIVRDAVSDLSGSVDALAHGVLGGAVFTVRLPLIGNEE